MSRRNKSTHCDRVFQLDRGAEVDVPIKAEGGVKTEQHKMTHSSLNKGGLCLQNLMHLKVFT